MREELMEIKQVFEIKGKDSTEKRDLH